MASVVNDSGGRRRVQFEFGGKRRTLRLGKCDLKTARLVVARVEALVLSKATGQPLPAPTAAWVQTLGPELREKLERCGLVEPERRLTVRELVERYMSRADVRASTKAVRGCWARELVDFLGDRPIETVQPSDAERFRDYLIARGLAGATVARQIRFARQLFRQAVLSGDLARNPFDVLAHNFKEGKLPDRDYARIEDVERLLEVCPPAWRVLVALARYAGLRCPSEGLLLRWRDVDLPGRRLTVTSPKTANVGKPWRLVPIVPRLAELLEEAWDAAPEGAEFVVELPQYRGKSDNWVGCNMRTQLARLMRRAGVFWRRPFRVFRSSCVTDWARAHPIHAVAAWAGHTVAVAGKHYLTVTDEDFARAARWMPPTGPAAGIDAGEQATSMPTTLPPPS